MFGVGSIRDCRAYSALACGYAVGFGIVAFITERGARIDIGADVEKRLEVAAIAGLTTERQLVSHRNRSSSESWSRSRHASDRAPDHAAPFCARRRDMGARTY